jgi:hypothetical protein
VWRSHSRVSYVHLPEQRSFTDCGLYFRSIREFALPHFRDVPQYLSRCFAEHFYDVVLRDILRRMFEKDEMVFAARNYGPVG